LTAAKLVELAIRGLEQFGHNGRRMISAFVGAALGRVRLADATSNVM
jgi:hypothetical protein